MAIDLAGDDRRSGVVHVQLRLGRDFVVSRRWLGQRCFNGLIARVAFGWVGERLGAFGGVAGLGNNLRDGTPLGLIAIKQRGLGGATADQGKFPGQIDRVLQAAVHAVSFGGRA